MKKKGLLERLKEGPVLGDGGYLLELEKRGWVRAGPFTPEVALLHPEALRQLHIEFREAGADVLQALTFYASRDKLATVGLENRLEDLNRAAVRIAREVAVDVMIHSAIASPMIVYRGPFVLQQPEEAWFDCNMMQKDMLLAMDLGRKLNVPLPTTAVSNEFLTAARGMGWEKQDFAVVFDVLARMSGIQKQV